MKEQSVWKGNISSWKQMEEDKKDWQYFKKYDDAKLQKTLDNTKEKGYILTLS